jgi:acetyl esterase/lipase
MKSLPLLCAAFAIALPVSSLAQKAPAPKASKAPKAAAPQPPPPTLANVPYGDHPRQVLDFWRADSPSPAPVLFFIHGGGWNAGDKSRIATFFQVPDFLREGISVVSINYRLIPQAVELGVSPPVKAPLHDAARALQFVRSKAAEWNLDKLRIGASGGSAGACSSLWLAFHDDLANPSSPDPVARESTRLWCAAVSGAQTTLDPAQMREWTPNSRYGAHAFGIFRNVKGKPAPDFEAFLARRQEILPWIAEYSPYALVTPDDAPIYLQYNAAPALGQDQKDPTHTSNFGVKLQERCRAVGLDCELAYPGAPDVRHPDSASYLIARLKKTAR